MKHIALSLSWVAMALGTTLPAWAGKAHEHGVMKLDAAVDGKTLSVRIDSPLDSFLGFERAPRTDAERKAAADLLARLRSPATGTPLFNPDAAAQCTLGKVEVQAPVIEPGGAAALEEGHADLNASFEFTCAQPQHLRRLDLALFDAYRRLTRIDVQVAGAQGQSKLTLKRPARSIPLAR